MEELLLLEKSEENIDIGLYEIIERLRKLQKMYLVIQTLAFP